MDHIVRNARDVHDYFGMVVTVDITCLFLTNAKSQVISLQPRSPLHPCMDSNESDACF